MRWLSARSYRCTDHVKRLRTRRRVVLAWVRCGLNALAMIWHAIVVSTDTTLLVLGNPALNCRHGSGVSQA